MKPGFLLVQPPNQPRAPFVPAFPTRVTTARRSSITCRTGSLGWSRLSRRPGNKSLWVPRLHVDRPRARELAHQALTRRDAGYDTA